MSPFTLRHCSTTWYSGPSEYDGASDDEEGFKVIGAAPLRRASGREDSSALEEDASAVAVPSVTSIASGEAFDVPGCVASGCDKSASAGFTSGFNAAPPATVLSIACSAESVLFSGTLGTSIAAETASDASVSAMFALATPSAPSVSEPPRRIHGHAPRKLSCVTDVSG